MYKLAVVSGPNQGTSYPLPNGESSIGRQAGNAIALPSSKISKKHCTLVVDNEGVTLKDEGSSNGTFINGILVKTKKLKGGDRISVGEYVLELVDQPKSTPRKMVPVRKASSVFQFPPQNTVSTPSPNISDLNASQSHANQPPKDLKGKALWFFEHSFMPIFYGMNLKNEWRVLCLGLLAFFIIGNLGIIVYPLLESSRVTVVKETLVRARFLAKQIAEQNAPMLAARAETKTDIGIIENAEGVRVALLTDLDSRIIAPGSKLNQYFTSGIEASYAVTARDYFRTGRETGLAAEVEPGTVVAVEPVKILNPAAGKNVVAAMAIVSIDTTLSTPDLGEMGVVYAEAMIMTGIFGMIIFIIMYRLTLKPFQVLNEDMDKALKGDLSQVTHEYKFEELNSLWEIINSAIQRIPKAGDSGTSSMGMSSFGSSAAQEFEGPLKMIGETCKQGVVILDGERKILYLNGIFEEISGIRSDGAIGRSLSEVGRDQSMGAFANDLLDRASPGTEGVSEDYDFSGISYKVHSAAFGSPGQGSKCYILLTVRNE